MPDDTGVVVEIGGLEGVLWKGVGGWVHVKASVLWSVCMCVSPQSEEGAWCAGIYREGCCPSPTPRGGVLSMCDGHTHRHITHPPLLAARPMGPRLTPVATRFTAPCCT